MYYRKQNGLYQYKLAEMVGICKESLNHIERGRAIPSIPTLALIAAILGITLKDLLGNKEEDEN
jgi:Predicted transcriptional regulators